MAKLMVVDGNSLTYRAFFALPTDMATASGQVTNAVYGFTSMLINLIKDHQPASVVVTFDRPEPTFRHEAVAYKAQRDETPDILRQQMGLVREVVAALGITMVEQAGWEADDIIATIVEQVRPTRGSGPHRHRRPRQLSARRRRAGEGALQPPRRERLRAVRRGRLFESEPGSRRSNTQIRRCCGDPADNLPGCPGVVEKTAAKLINTYGGLDGIFAQRRQPDAEAEGVAQGQRGPRRVRTMS